MICSCKFDHEHREREREGLKTLSLSLAQGNAGECFVELSCGLILDIISIKQTYEGKEKEGEHACNGAVEQPKILQIRIPKPRNNLLLRQQLHNRRHDPRQGSSPILHQPTIQLQFEPRQEAHIRAQPATHGKADL